MNHTRKQLAAQRAKLITQAAHQRAELTLAFASLHGPLALADKGLHALRYLGKHPVLLSAGVAIVFALRRPKRWFLLLESGWLAWRMGVAAKRRLEG
jgi:YqjK-like protein